MTSPSATGSPAAPPRAATWGRELSGRGRGERRGIGVERLLQILMGTLATLGTLLLGMGQRNLLLPVLMLLAVVTSIVFSDTLRWFRLHRTVANLAAVVAVGFSLSEFFTRQDDTQRQLLAIAHLLIYLQVVLLYQRKSERIYWQLAVLSLLQVVVAAALNVGFEFGVVLVVFCVVALLALSVFFVHRTSSRFPEAAAADPPREAATIGKSRAAVRPTPFPSLLGAPPRAVPQALAEDINREMLGWGFLRHVLGLGLATIVFTAVFFYCTPRTVSSDRRASGRQPVVGFTNEVRLNELGKIAESNELVMRVHFSDVATGQPYNVLSEPYFRGMVLNQYDTSGPRPTWKHRRPPISRPPVRLPTTRPREGLVLQEILLQPRPDNLLFAVAPARQLPSFASDQRVLTDSATEQLFRGSDRPLKLTVPHRYLLVTDAFREGVQQSFRLRYWDDQRPDADRLRLAMAKRMLLESYDPGRFPRLSAMAAEIVRPTLRADATLAPSRDPLTKARLLVNHFHDPERYRYTLDFRNVPRSPNLDPIEDFVANHRSGHCEYFASALTMMLRSQGIPARMVVGYKGVEFNQLGGYFQVRQSSAHAWVEAFIEAEHLPEGMRRAAQGEHKLAGAWLRLDPTPGENSGRLTKRETGLIGRMGQALDYAQLLWSDYVLGLSPERQKEAGLQPFVPDEPEDHSAWWSFAGWRDAAARLLQSLGLDFYNWRLRDWFSWRAGLAAMTLATLVLLAYRLAAFGWRRLTWPRRVARKSQTRRRIRVDFFERLERILEGHGLRRAPHQTQREFVLAAAESLRAAGPPGPPSAGSRKEPAEAELPAAGQLAADAEPPTWSGLLEELVDRFYDVRFGERTLDKPESQAIEHALARLEQALAKTPPR